jgi:hypothetical protein
MVLFNGTVAFTPISAPAPITITAPKFVTNWFKRAKFPIPAPEREETVSEGTGMEMTLEPDEVEVEAAAESESETDEVAAEAEEDSGSGDQVEVGVDSGDRVEGWGVQVDVGVRFWVFVGDGEGFGSSFCCCPPPPLPPLNDHDIWNTPAPGSWESVQVTSNKGVENKRELMNVNGDMETSWETEM